MNSILIYDLTGHCNSPLNTDRIKLLGLLHVNCFWNKRLRMTINHKKENAIRKFLGQRKKQHRSKQRRPQISHPVYLFRNSLSKSFLSDDGQKVGALLKGCCSVTCVIYGATGSKEEDGSIWATSEQFIKTYFTQTRRETWLFISQSRRVR